ncbi:MAG TPA: hypothetical protein VG013_17020 [Gemmataceae bacterium]|jgi:hypothetical protein|nr:hypothetical protein [Gemmataceae bacterium]
MDHTPDSGPDGIDDFLEKGLPLAGGEHLRPALLTATTRVIRRRQRVRQIGLLAALAACYAAGLMTVRLAMPPPQAHELERVQETPRPVDKTGPVPAPAVRPSQAERHAPALTVEWQAVDSRVKRPDLFRRAGDRYLEEAGDFQSAVRCYRSALHDGAEEDLTISVDDNWLLMALKQAKEREKRHAKSNGPGGASRPRARDGRGGADGKW